MTKSGGVKFGQAFVTEVIADRWAVAKGYFDVFNDEHFDHMRNRQHGADVLSSTPPEATLMIRALKHPPGEAVISGSGFSAQPCIPAMFYDTHCGRTISGFSPFQVPPLVI